MKNKKRIVVIIDGPSGVGKDTVIKKLEELNPLFKKVPSLSTRPMRPGESQGVPYIFVTDEEFEEKVNTGEIFERTIRHGTHRGMSKKIFDDAMDNGFIPLKDCDKTGIIALRNIYKDKVFGVFLIAPKEVIMQRLKKRQDKDIKKRMDDYDVYINQKIHYDKIIENIDLDTTIKKVYDEIMKFYKSK